MAGSHTRGKENWDSPPKALTYFHNFSNVLHYIFQSSTIMFSLIHFIRTNKNNIKQSIWDDTIAQSLCFPHLQKILYKSLIIRTLEVAQQFSLFFTIINVTRSHIFNILYQQAYWRFKNTKLCQLQLHIKASFFSLLFTIMVSRKPQNLCNDLLLTYMYHIVFIMAELCFGNGGKYHQSLLHMFTATHKCTRLTH